METSTVELPRAAKKRRRRFAIPALILLAAFGIAGFGVFWAYHASQQVPEFYLDAIKEDVAVQKKASDEFLQQATAIASDVRKGTRWEATFTDDQINGWLAVDLPQNYPDLLPPEIALPRVALHRREAILACRYTADGVSTVFSLNIDVYLVEPGKLALHVRNAHAGALLIPLSRILDGISEAAENMNVRLEWRQTEGEPVAIVTLPTDEQHDKRTQIDTIEVREGEIFLAGSSSESPDDSSESEDVEQEGPAYRAVRRLHSATSGRSSAGEPNESGSNESIQR